MFGISASGEGVNSVTNTYLFFIVLLFFLIIIIAMFIYRRYFLRNRVRVRIIYPDNKIKTHVVKDAQETWELGECTYIIDTNKILHDKWGKIIYFYHNNPLSCSNTYQSLSLHLSVTKKNKKGVLKTKKVPIDGKILKNIITTKLISLLYQDGELTRFERMLMIGGLVLIVLTLYTAWVTYQGQSLNPEVYSKIGNACKEAILNSGA